MGTARKLGARSAAAPGQNYGQGPPRRHHRRVTAHDIFRSWHRHMITDAAIAQRRHDALERERQRRVLAARGLLLRDGTLRRVARVRRAIRGEAFRCGFLAKDRASARGVEDLCRLAVEVLVDLGVDMTDVQLTMRRAAQNELKLRPLPSYEAARRALARVDGQPADSAVPLDELLAAAPA